MTSTITEQPATTSTTHFGWCDGRTEHSPADGGLWHERRIGLITTRANDLADEDDRPDAPFLVSLMAHDDQAAPGVALTIEGWAEVADLSLDDARRARDVFATAVALLEQAGGER